MWARKEKCGAEFACANTHCPDRSFNSSVIEQNLCFVGISNDSSAKQMSSSMLNESLSSIVEKKLLFPNERNYAIDVETKLLQPIKRSFLNSIGTNVEYESKVSHRVRCLAGRASPEWKRDTVEGGHVQG